MIKELTRLANHLDSKGLRKEADYLDRIISKIASPDINPTITKIHTVEPGDTLEYIAKIYFQEQQKAFRDMLDHSLFIDQNTYERWEDLYYAIITNNEQYFKGDIEGYIKNKSHPESSHNIMPEDEQYDQNNIEVGMKLDIPSKIEGLDISIEDLAYEFCSSLGEDEDCSLFIKTKQRNDGIISNTQPTSSDGIIPNTQPTSSYIGEFLRDTGLLSEEEYN